MQDFPSTHDSSPPSSVDLRVEEIRVRFEAAWQAGPAPRIDDFLGETTAAERLALLRELVLVDVSQRRQRGEDVPAADYLRRFPELDAVWLDSAIRSGLSATIVPPPVVSQTLSGDTPTWVVQATGRPAIQIPGYEILGKLGEGAMGVVLRGRDIELGRELAVKILLEGRQDDPQAVRRFLEEAQVGGQLQHPGVAPVYEAGRLPDRRPYFTMKLVEGRTLAALLAERPTPAHDLPRFLKIFEQICQTLAYAHSRGVIHRDLKPLNVMVGAFGEVQVMDWGMAKVLGRDVRTVRSEQPEARTEDGAVLGTPAYMPPEQACGEVNGLDARADVFGLGAVLCEVLTGAPPYRGREAKEVRRMAARAELTDAFARLDACGAEPELSQMAKACLAAEPAERPADGGAVAAAAAAYLAGVQERLRKAELERAAAQARAEEAQAKTRAEMRARRMTAALAATVLLAVTGIGGGMLWYVLDRAARAGEYALKAASTERDVTAALEEAAAFARQAEVLHDDPTKWEAALLEALSAVKRADGVLNNGVDDTHQLRGRVDALGVELESADRDRRMVARLEAARFQEAAAGKDTTFDQTGAAALYAKAFQQDDKDWDSLDAQKAADRINDRAIRDDLLAALADWLSATANKPEAERLRSILQAADPDPTTLRNRWNAAVARKDADALRQLAASPEAKDQPTARLVLFGNTLAGLGAAAEAVKLLKEAKERRPSDFWIAFELAYACQQTRPPATDEAARYYTGALMLRPTSAAAHNNLGAALADKGLTEEAIVEFRKALKIQPDDALTRNNLGNALADAGRPDEAITEYNQVLKTQPDGAQTHYNLGNAFAQQHRWDDAIAQYQTAVKLKPDFAGGHNNLGNALAAKGQWDQAIPEFDLALKYQPKSADAHYNLGVAHSARYHMDQAIAEFRKALESQPDHAHALNGLGVALRATGQLDEAIATFRKALDIQPDDAQTHYNLGNAFAQKRQWDDAVAQYRTAVELKPDFARAWCSRADILQVQGRFGEALAAYRRGDELGAHIPNWRYPSAQWVREAEDLAERDALLPAILHGAAGPADAVQQVRFAEFCQQYKRLFATASGLYADGFAAEPALAEDPASGARYTAACSAALAGCGKGDDAEGIDAKERGRWRRQARDWLKAELVRMTKTITPAESEDRAGVSRALSHWKVDSDLAGVRDRDALAKLPADEQDAWRKLWDEVDALLKKAQEK